MVDQEWHYVGITRYVILVHISRINMQRRRERECKTRCPRVAAGRRGGHVFDVNYKTPLARPPPPLLPPLSTLARGQRRRCGAFPALAIRSILNLMNLWPSVFRSTRKKFNFLQFQGFALTQPIGLFQLLI